MNELLFAPYLTPFSAALGLLFGLLLLELFSALLGGTVLGLGGDTDVDLDVVPDLEVDFDAEFDLETIEAIEIADAPEIQTDLDTSSLTGWLGLGGVPFLIWLASFLGAFGLSGIILQKALIATIGSPLPAWIAGFAATLPALAFARGFSRIFARLIPKTETQALSANHLGRRRGIVSQGTARRGKPAEVRVNDRYGNTHHIRAEPLRDDQSIPAGTEVLVLRKSLDEGYRLVPLPE